MSLRAPCRVLTARRRRETEDQCRHSECQVVAEGASVVAEGAGEKHRRLQDIHTDLKTVGCRHVATHGASASSISFSPAVSVFPFPAWLGEAPRFNRDEERRSHYR